MISVEQLFLQVVESGSFKKAAEQLNYESSSISRKIAALEDRLEVKLLRRSTQHTTPTELGQQYYERLRGLINEKMALEEEISSGVNRLRGKLRIAAPVDFGTRFVVPVLHQMQQQAPELVVELLLGSHFENLLEQNLDAAVRIGVLPDSTLIAKKLGENARVLVASPSYLAERGVPETVEQLALHNFVLYSPIQPRSHIEFVDGSHFPFSKIHSNITVNSLSAVRYLVLEGVGIHLGPLWAFKEDLASKRLIQVLPDCPLHSFPIHVVYLTKSYLPFKIKEFTRLLSDRIKSNQ